MRLAVYNIEWFDKLFEKDNSLKTDTESRQRLTAIAEVIATIKPDILGIVEAPNHMNNGSKKTTACLQNFSSQFNLNLSRSLIGFPSPGQQEIAVMFNPQVCQLSHNPDGNGKKNPPFNESFEFDTDDDRIKEVYKFYRPPLELDVNEVATGKSFKLIIAHTKSKGIFSAVDMVHWQRENERNRRKLFAECNWIRRRVDSLLENNHSVVVMGDINDGPGMDQYEFQFGRSAVEIIMGDIFQPDRLLQSHTGRPKWKAGGWVPSSTRFKDRFTETNINVLIDHILVSRDLAVQADSHRVWNPYQLDEARGIRSALKKASDHYPVTIDLL